MAKDRTEEQVKEVVITPDDCNAAMDFWSHFQIPVTPELKAAMEAFAKNPSVETQDNVKLEVCKAIATTEHNAFKDEMFKKIVEECSNVVYDMEFERDLEATLSSKKE